MCAVDMIPDLPDIKSTPRCIMPDWRAALTAGLFEFAQGAGVSAADIERAVGVGLCTSAQEDVP